MPHRLALAAALLLVTTSLACANRGDERYYWQRDPLTSFGAYRTYAIERNLEPYFDALGAEARQVIEEEIQRQMTADGFTKAEPGRQADVVVRYFGGPERTMMIDQSGGTVRDSTGRLRGRTAALGEHHYVPMEISADQDRPAERREGRLVIEVVNPRTGTGMWRGTAENALPNTARGWNETTAQQARDAVAGLFQQFPPQ